MSAMDGILTAAIQLAHAYVRDAQGRNKSGRTTINEAKQVVRDMITAAIAEARREGAEAMQQERQAMRLTDEQIRAIVDALQGGPFGYAKFCGWLDLSRAIERAVLAANGLGGGAE